MNRDYIISKHFWPFFEHLDPDLIRIRNTGIRSKLTNWVKPDQPGVPLDLHAVVNCILMPRHVFHVCKPLTAQVAGEVTHTYSVKKIMYYIFKKITSSPVPTLVGGQRWLACELRLLSASKKKSKAKSQKRPNNASVSNYKNRFKRWGPSKTMAVIK